MIHISHDCDYCRKRPELWLIVITRNKRTNFRVIICFQQNVTEWNGMPPESEVNSGQLTTFHFFFIFIRNYVYKPVLCSIQWRHKVILSEIERVIQEHELLPTLITLDHSWLLLFDNFYFIFKQKLPWTEKC